MSEDRFRPDGNWGEIQYSEGKDIDEDDPILLMIKDKEQAIRNGASKEELDKKEKAIWDRIYKKNLMNMIT